MNLQDFCNKFSASYFAVSSTAVEDQIPELKGREHLWLPACNPRAVILDSSPKEYGTLFSVHLRDKNSPSVYRTAPVKLLFREDADEDRNIFYSRHPKLGTMAAGDTVCYLRRIPQRATSRGYNPRSVNMLIPNAVTMAEISGLLGTSSIEVVWNIFNRKMWTYREALEDIEQGNLLGAPLSRYLGIYVDHRRMYPRFLYMGRTIGYLKNGEILVYNSVEDLAKDHILQITGIVPRVK